MIEGDTLRSIGDRSGAAAAYRAEATLLTAGEPGWVTVQHKLAVTLLEDGLPIAAIDASKAVATAAPGDAIAHTLLGIAYRQTGELTLSKESFTTALTIDPANVAANQALAADGTPVSAIVPTAR